MLEKKRVSPLESSEVPLQRSVGEFLNMFFLDIIRVFREEKSKWYFFLNLKHCKQHILEKNPFLCVMILLK